MKDVRFYVEYDNQKQKRTSTRKNLINHNGNVVAVIENTRRIDRGDIVNDAIGSVYFHPNSDVCSTSVSDKYLSERCKRISENQARQIHPNLFND